MKTREKTRQDRKEKMKERLMKSPLSGLALPYLFVSAVKGFLEGAGDNEECQKSADEIRKKRGLPIHHN